MKKCLGSVLLVAVLLLAGCYTVPETGRTSLILPVVDDVAQGTAAFAELKTKERVSTDAIANERVQRIGRRIAAAVGEALPLAKWEFVVFDAPATVNAFALPGGKVGIYSGLLGLVESDDEIACVMGHEIAHVTARHGAERITEGVLVAAGALVLDASTSGKKNHDLFLVGYGVAAGGGMLAFSRKHESEADYIGIRYAAKAGYDPRAAISFWKKMTAENDKAKGGLGTFFLGLLSTHPQTTNRITDLQQWMPETLPLYEAAKLKYRN